MANRTKPVCLQIIFFLIFFNNKGSHALNFFIFYFFLIFTLADVFKNQPFPIICPLDQAQTSFFHNSCCLPAENFVICC